jgi:hypothetical protein
MSKKIDKINLYDCNFCKKASKCSELIEKNDSIPCSLFKLIDLDIRMVSE